MTALTKPVTRRTDLDPQLGRKASGPVAVTLYPSGDIGFRKSRCKKEFRLSLAAVYSIAMKAETAAQRRQKAADKKNRRNSR